MNRERRISVNNIVGDLYKIQIKLAMAEAKINKIADEEEKDGEDIQNVNALNEAYERIISVTDHIEAICHKLEGARDM